MDQGEEWRGGLFQAKGVVAMKDMTVNALHDMLSRFGWEMRPDLHEAGMTKHDEARARGELISRTTADHFAVFSHPEVPGYVEVAGDNQFWWIPALEADVESGPYGETVEELETFLGQATRIIGDAKKADWGAWKAANGDRLGLAVSRDAELQAKRAYGAAQLTRWLTEIAAIREWLAQFPPTLPRDDVGFDEVVRVLMDVWDECVIQCNYWHGSSQPRLCEMGRKAQRRLSRVGSQTSKTGSVAHLLGEQTPLAPFDLDLVDLLSVLQRIREEIPSLEWEVEMHDPDLDSEE